MLIPPHNRPHTDDFPLDPQAQPLPLPQLLPPQATVLSLQLEFGERAFTSMSQTVLHLLHLKNSHPLHHRPKPSFHLLSLGKIARLPLGHHPSVF